MEDVCESLDQTVLEIFQVLADLYDAKTKMEEEMKEGFFQMSRSRYSIGVKRVNADQILDAELSCTQCVSVLENARDILDLYCEESDSKADSKLNVFKLENKRNVTQDINKGLDELSISDGDKSTELRKRGKIASGEKQSEDLAAVKTCESSSTKLPSDETSDKENKGKKFVLTNPINLFGVLVPQSLRTSQQKFETAVSLSVDIANLQVQLSMLQRKYLHLKEKKEKISFVKEL